MSEASPPVDRRAQATCFAGLLIQAVLFGAVLTVGLYADNRSDAVLAGARHLLGGLPIWLILLIIFGQRRRSHIENLETEQLRRAQESGEATNIFDVGDESILLERRRLAWTYKFLLPTFAVLTGLYLILGAIFAWPWSIGQSLVGSDWQRVSEPFVPMLCMGGAAFFCFVYARYVIGMAKQLDWRMLRAGGSYLLGNALAMTVLVLALALAGSKTTQLWAEPLAAYVIRLTMLLLGLEILANFILDFYRPRQPDDEIRPAFDSRLLALFSESGGIMRSIADTVNYQFGFEVSSTWFYQLLRRSVFPLAMLTVVALIGLSAVVIVDVDEQIVIQRFGAVLQQENQTMGSGFHLKLPWPIDRVVRTRVSMVRSLVVGHSDAAEDVEHDAEQYPDHEKEDHPLLWTEEHDFNAEMLMLVANPEVDSLDFDTSPESGSSRRSRSVGVSLLMISMPIEYRIKSLHDFNFRYIDPEKVFESIAYQELSDFTSGVDIAYLMGRGRIEFGDRMREVLQRRCDELALGIEITFVALQDAHPPSRSEVAATFQNVVAAEIRKGALIEEANGLADHILTLVAGSVDRAAALDEAIQETDRRSAEAERQGTPQAIEAAAQAEALVDALLTGDSKKGIPPASGDVAAEIADARAERATVISESESKARTFKNDVLAFNAAPRLFRMRRYLDMLKTALPPLRKFVFTGNPDELIIEYETKQRAYLDLETAEPGQ